MKCPGQDSRFWGPEAISESSCPKCGGPVEFFKDESSRKCRRCGTRVLNPKMDFGCAAYCRFAAQCLGDDLSPELLARRTDLLKDRVSGEVKKFLGRDFRRIGRALKVMEYAARIQQAEGGDPAAVTLAACLSAIAGAGAATGREGCGGVFCPEDVTRAGSILSRAGAPEELAREVLSILGSLGSLGGSGARRDDSAGFRCVSDAVRIAEAAEAVKAGRRPPGSGGNAPGDGALFTPEGGKIMKQVLEEPPGP